MCQIFFWQINEFQVFFLNSKLLNMPIQSFFAPVVKPFRVFLGVNKVFKLHHLKFPDAEKKITRRNFVAESFADLGNSKRQFYPRGLENIVKINKNPLGGFGPQIS